MNDVERRRFGKRFERAISGQQHTGTDGRFQDVSA